MLGCDPSPKRDGLLRSPEGPAGRRAACRSPWGPCRLSLLSPPPPPDSEALEDDFVTEPASCVRLGRVCRAGCTGSGVDVSEVHRERRGCE
eukprot:353843-Chlamydomonas_euryale.AAC.10